MAGPCNLISSRAGSGLGGEKAKRRGALRGNPLFPSACALSPNYPLLSEFGIDEGDEAVHGRLFVFAFSSDFHIFAL